MWYMTPERELLQTAIRDFAEKEIRPFVPQMEDDAYPTDIIKKMGKLGILGLVHDEKYGGTGEDHINWHIALEEISRVSVTAALLAATTSQCCAYCAEELLTPGQVEKYIKPAVRGEIILGQWGTEPGGMTTVSDFETTAVRDGDGWVINGSKIFSTNAGICDYGFVICRTAENPDPTTGLGASILAVSKDNPGYSVGHIENKFGLHGSHTGQVYFNDCHVPADALIGAVDGSMPYLIGRLNPVLSMYGAMALGAAEGVYQKTRAYLAGRIQTGRSLWECHQVIRNQMSEMWMKIELLRHALYGYAEYLNQGKKNEGVALALKIEGSKLAKEVCDTCMTLHGGLGVVVETDVERFYRDVKMLDLACGSNLSLIDSWSYSL